MCPGNAGAAGLGTTKSLTLAVRPWGALKTPKAQVSPQPNFMGISRFGARTLMFLKLPGDSNVQSSQELVGCGYQSNS